MQTNKTLTNLNLGSNDLGPEGGIAIAKSLEVNLPYSMLSRSLMTLNMCERFLSRHFFFFMQVNETLTNLSLAWNDLGPEGAKAMAKCLEVSLSTSMSTLN
jgi:hypothetical protein